MWDDQIEALAGKFRVVRYDTRGHGRSSATPGAYSLDLLADDLKGLLDSLHIAKAHLVGLSMGGMIGQIFGLKCPSMLHTLVLCDTSSMYPETVVPIWHERIRIAQTQGHAGFGGAHSREMVHRAFSPREPSYDGAV